MVTSHLPGIYLSGFSPQLNFSFDNQFHSPIFCGFLDILVLFICLFVMPLSKYPLYYLLTSIFRNRKEKRKEFLRGTYALLLQYQYADQILSSNSSNSSPKFLLKFFFLPLFLKPSNWFATFFTLLLFLIWLGNLFQYIYVTLLVIMMMMLYYKHGFPWPSLATHLYRPSLPGGLQGYILYRHRAVVYRL